MRKHAHFQTEEGPILFFSKIFVFFSFLSRKGVGTVGWIHTQIFVHVKNAHSLLIVCVGEGGAFEISNRCSANTFMVPKIKLFLAQKRLTVILLPSRH